MPAVLCHILLKAVCNDDFPTRPNARAYKAFQNKLREKKEKSGSRTSFHYLDNDDEHWVIVDSGANRNYLSRRDFLSRCDKINVTINGFGPNRVEATAQGLFTGCLFDKRGRRVPFESFGMYVPGAKVSLLSVSQANWGDNDVTHHGNPVKGKHGLTLATGEFIPFEYCHETGLYWAKITKAPPRSVLLAEERLDARIAVQQKQPRVALNDDNDDLAQIMGAYNAWVVEKAHGDASAADADATTPVVHAASCSEGAALRAAPENSD